MITKLVVFDFDSTLFYSPLPEDGNTIYKERTGKYFPDKGWWSSSASLDTNVFDIYPYKGILDILNKEKANPNTAVIK